MCHQNELNEKRRALIAAARACLGTPFRHQGRSPGRGVDCSGLCLVAAWGAGLALADVRGYGREPIPARMGAELAARCEVITRAALKPADIVWLRFDGDPMHLAIYTERDTLIHSIADGPRRVVEHGFRAPWPGRVIGCYRLRGIDD